MPLQAEVRRFADDGSVLATLPTAQFGIHTGALCVACDPGMRLLVLASQEGKGQPLVAVNFATGALAWRAEEPPGMTFGLVALPAAGVVVVGSYSDAPDSVSVHRLSDGRRVATATVRGVTYMTADAATGTIYVSTSRSVLEVLRWDGKSLMRLDPFRLVPHLPPGASHTPLCVMPNAEHEGGAPNLIVGVQVSGGSGASTAAWGDPLFPRACLCRTSETSLSSASSTTPGRPVRSCASCAWLQASRSSGSRHAPAAARSSSWTCRPGRRECCRGL